MPTITPRQLHDRLQQGEKLHLLDVRTPAEYSEIHVADSHLEPLDRLDDTKLASATGFTKYQPIYLFCRSGDRAGQAAARLAKKGYDQCYVVEGGVLAWAAAGLPVIRGAVKVISLERQVRIAAGAVVLIGAALAHFVNPLFIWLSGFVGAGLVFAGISGWCGIGMLIAMMPWNQRGASCAK